MKAAIYDHKGPARVVLRIVDLPLPEPATGEVRVRVACSGVNPSDVKTRAGSSNPAMEYPQVVPHNDGAGVIDAVGAGVETSRIGQRVWLFNAQWGRAHGTAAEALCLPARLAVPLPAAVPFEVGAGLGVPLLTAAHAVRRCGALQGRTLLVPGAAGVVGHYLTQFAAQAGARVIAVVSSEAKAQRARLLGARDVIDYRREDLVDRVAALTAGRGVDAMIDLDAARHGPLYHRLLAFDGTVVIYGSNGPTIELPFRPLILAQANLHFFIVYKLPQPLLDDTVVWASERLASGALEHPRIEAHPLQDIAAAHEAVERGADAKVVLRLEPQPR